LMFLILSPFDVHGVPPIETIGGGPVRPVDATRAAGRAAHGRCARVY
jgi:hypothetical protein